MNLRTYSSVDPSILEGRVDNEHGMGALDYGSPDPAEDDLPLIENIQALVNLLPPREADFVELYYFKHCRQTDIAQIFAVSQPTVCYRLQRAVSRIRFLRKYLSIDVAHMEKVLLEFFKGDTLDVQILMTMYESTCQMETSRRLQVTPGKVRHRFLRALERFKQVQDPEVLPYAKLFIEINDNLNILKEVSSEDPGEKQFLFDTPRPERGRK